jgi:signal transduction histidine kinase/AmiR/NasT family two-component response regulator
VTVTDYSTELFGGDDETSAAHRDKDWAKNSLGPVGSWPAELRAAVRTVMPSRTPVLLWWGPELVQIFNDAFRPALGEKYPAAVGQPGSECWAEVWDTLGPLAGQVLAGGPATYAENQRLYLHRHGYLEETYWTFSCSPVHATDDAVAGVLVTAGDVTVRALAERRLETLRQLGPLSVAGAGTPAGVCRAAVGTLAADRADFPAVAIHLRDPDGTVRPTASSGPVDRTDIEDAVREASVTGKAVRLPDAVAAPLVTGTAVAGVLVLGLSTHRAFDDAYATFVGLVVARVTSVVGDAMAYAGERERAEALAELDLARSRFFQNISHEFRTPLTLLLGPLTTLLDEPGGDLEPGRDVRELLRVAHRAAQRLNRLVDDLLVVATAEADRLSVRPVPTDVATFTAECVSMFRSAAEHAGLELVVDVEPVTAMVDQEMWARIVLNLVSNALKYTTHGLIAVTLRNTAAGIVLTVTDTGDGIAPDQQDRVFDRFHRAERAVGDGSGIGLAVVSELSAALGGRVTVDSTPGDGSTFTVTVPLVPTTERPAPTPERVAELGATYAGETRDWEPPPAAQDEPGSRRRVLLVEDNADVRDYVTRLLVHQNWTVDAVGDADTALARVKGDRPDLVLSDVMLPGGKDGIDLLRTVRADSALARLPVILLTARAGAEAAVEGLRHGADDYVVKPFHPAELVNRVRVHLELSRFRETLLRRGEEETANLRRGMSTRTTIGQAVGILMVIHKCAPDEAFTRLVTMSQHRNTKLHDVAHTLVQQFTATLTAQG